jgi:hypothetical protein
MTVATGTVAGYFLSADCSTGENDFLGVGQAVCEAQQQAYGGTTAVLAILYGASTLYGVSAVSRCDEAMDEWVARETAQAKRDAPMYRYGTEGYCDVLFARLMEEPEVHRLRLVRALPRDCRELLKLPADR